MLPHGSCSLGYPLHSAAPAPLALPLPLTWLLSWRLLYRPRPQPSFLSRVPPTPPALCALASLSRALPPASAWLISVPLEEADGDSDMVAEAFDHQARAEIEDAACHAAVVDAACVLPEAIEDLMEEQRWLVRVAVWLVLVRAVTVTDGRVHLVPGVGLAIVRAASRGAVVVGGMSYVRITILMMCWLFGY